MIMKTSRLLYIFSIIFFHITLLSCNLTEKEPFDTMIIIDAFSTENAVIGDGPLKKDIQRILITEINAKYKKNRKSKEKILIYFGPNDGDLLELQLDSELSNSSFREYDKRFNDFRAQNLKKVGEAIIKNAISDQSSFIRVFGEQLLSKSRKHKINKVIMIGNLVEKDFINMAIRRATFFGDTVRKKKEAIEDRFNILKKEFAKYYNSNQSNKTDILLYVTREEIDHLIYSEKIYHKFYVQKIIQFLKNYNNDQKIRIMNEF